MNDLIQIIFLSIIQGVTEFLPISSSAHLNFIPKLLKWDALGLPLEVSMHFGSLLAVIYYYIKYKNEFINLESTKNYIGFEKITIGSAPVLFFGFFFYDYIANNLRGMEIIGISTIFVAILLIIVEFFKKEYKNISNINNLDIFFIGLLQATSLIPGTSRSAVIILGALLLGYNKKSAIIITLILSVPVILIAMLYEIYSIDYFSINIGLIFKTSISIIISFLTSYIVIKYFVSYINKIGFYPFMIYRLALGIFLLSVFT